MPLNTSIFSHCASCEFEICRVSCVGYHFDFRSTHDSFEPSLTPRGNLKVVAGSLTVSFRKYRYDGRNIFKNSGPIFHCSTHAFYQHGHVLFNFPLCRRQLYPPLTYVGQPSPNFLSQHLRNPRRSRCFPALYQAFPPPPPLVSTANMFCLSTFCRLWINHEGKDQIVFGDHFLTECW